MTKLFFILVGTSFGNFQYAKNKDEKTPLDISIGYKCHELVEFLRDLGAKTSKELEKEER